VSDEQERWRVIRHYLATRAGHRCEICGVRLGPGNEGTVHHRQPHSRGGTSDPDIDLLSNLLLLCGGRLGGVMGCHGVVESERARSYEWGRLVRRPLDPAKVPVVLYGGRRRMLDPEQPFYWDPPDGVLYVTAA
jgi:hypothetical protein